MLGGFPLICHTSRLGNRFRQARRDVIEEWTEEENNNYNHTGHEYFGQYDSDKKLPSTEKGQQFTQKVGPTVLPMVFGTVTTSLYEALTSRWKFEFITSPVPESPYFTA